KAVWCYDYRTNIHHTLKRKPMRYEDLADFIACYQPNNINERVETYHPENNPDGRSRTYRSGELIARDKTSLELCCLRDKRLAVLDNLPEPEELEEEIIENLEAGLESFRSVLADLAN